MLKSKFFKKIVTNKNFYTSYRKIQIKFKIRNYEKIKLQNR